MGNVYSCSCVSDSMFGLSFDEIKKMVTCPSDLSFHVITIDETPENFYICCPIVSYFVIYLIEIICIIESVIVTEF